VTPNVGDATTYQDDADGNPLRTAYPDNYLDVRTYDAADQVASINQTRAGQSLNATTYTRDQAGRPTKVSSTIGGPQLYSYDAMGEVTGVCYADPCLSASAQIHFQYDAVGNRLQQTRPGTT